MEKMENRQRKLKKQENLNFVEPIALQNSKIGRFFK